MPAPGTHRGCLTFTRSRARSSMAVLPSGLHTTAFSRVTLASCHRCSRHCAAAVLYSTWVGKEGAELRGLSPPRHPTRLPKPGREKGAGHRNATATAAAPICCRRKGTRSSTAEKTLILRGERDKSRTCRQAPGCAGAAGSAQGKERHGDLLALHKFQSYLPVRERSGRIFLGFFLHATR